MPRIIVFYKTSSGRCPVEEFLDFLQDREARKAVWLFRLVERRGTIPAEYFKKLAGTESLWELRVQVGGKHCRFIGFYDNPTTLVVTNGFVKKQRKTPTREIELAYQRRNEYLQRRPRI